MICWIGLRNRALFRNRTDLSLVVSNDTRWSSNCSMLARHVRLFEAKLSVASSEKASIPIDAMLEWAQKYLRQLQEINVDTKELIGKVMRLSDSRMALDELMAAVREGHGDMDTLCTDAVWVHITILRHQLSSMIRTLRRESWKCSAVFVQNYPFKKKMRSIWQ